MVFLGVAWHFQLPGLLAGAQGLVPSRRVACAHCRAVCHEPPQFGCHSFACFLHGYVLRQIAVLNKADHLVFCILVKLLRHGRRFSYLPKRNKTWGTSQKLRNFRVSKIGINATLFSHLSKIDKMELDQIRSSM